MAPPNADANADLKKPGTTAAATARARGFSAKRQSQLSFLVIMWVAGFFWNLASPIKNWVLGRFEISKMEVTLNRDLKWEDELDYKFVKFLYEHAGVELDIDEGNSTRLINVYVDLMVLQKAKNWARNYNQWHQDPTIGYYCRGGLRPKREKQMEVINEIRNRPKNFSNWGQNVTNFLADGDDCRLSEITEAVMCIKNLNASGLINLEWSTGKNVSEPAVHEALVAWQNELMPDLNKCLQRRAELVKKHGGDQQEAVVELSYELSKNYSVPIDGWAGRVNLVAPYMQTEGFVDISGNKGGSRQISLSGMITERNRNNMDGDCHAMTAAREILWLCTYDRGQTYQDTPNPFKTCFEKEALIVPAAFYGLIVDRPLSEIGGRYYDDSFLTRGPKIGHMTEWIRNPVKPFKKAKYLTNPNTVGVEKAYLYEVDWPLFAEQTGFPATPWLDYIGFKCIYVPGCKSKCLGADKELGPSNNWFLYAVKKSGNCVLRRFEPDLFNRNGFVDKRCYGVGTGSSTLLMTVHTHNADRANWTTYPADKIVEIKNVTDPLSYLACLMGGRLPNEGERTFPLYFHDMVSQGTGMVLTIFFAEGSEKVLLNMLSLVSLGGCIIYSFWVLIEAFHMWKLYQRAVDTNNRRTAVQIASSISNTTISNRVWRVYYSYLMILGFFTIFTWYVGAARTMCSWSLDGVPISSIKPMDYNISRVPDYKCHGGDIDGHIVTFGEWIRFFSVSFVIWFTIMGRTKLLGINRYPSAYMVSGFYLGFLPTLLIPIITSALNHARLESPGLLLIHNQLFVGFLWILFMWLWNLALKWYLPVIYLSLRAFGVRPQPVQKGTLAYSLFQDYLVADDEYQPNGTGWVPLSVILELVDRRILGSLNIKTRRFEVMDTLSGVVLTPSASSSKYKTDKGEKVADLSSDHPAASLADSEVVEAPPQWVLDAPEFFVYLGTKLRT